MINRHVDPVAGLLSINEFPEKPPRMRWTTYRRLQKRNAAQANRSRERGKQSENRITDPKLFALGYDPIG